MPRNNYICQKPGCAASFATDAGYCTMCNRCWGCCSCGITGVRHFHHNLKPEDFLVPGLAERRINKSRRLIAQEIEVAGVRTDGNTIAVAVNKWKGSIVGDGSLPSGGFEINTTPAGGDLFLAQIDELTAALKAQSAYVDTSCGLHTHIDARDFSYYDMRRLLLLYHKVESSLFAVLPACRRNNTYCASCGEAYVKHLGEMKTNHASKAAIIQATYGTNNFNLKDYKRSKGASNRYRALNMHSWLYRGSLEFRLHSGSINPTKMKNWGMLLANMLDFAKRSPEKRITELPATFDTLLLIAPNQEIKDYLTARREQFAHQLSGHSGDDEQMNRF